MRKAFLIVGALIVAALGWGYWHVTSHAALHVALYDVGLKNDRQAYGQVLAADLVFTDANGATLAKARADKSMGIVSVIHPQVGDCRREEREASANREAWSQCFDTQSRWLLTWVPQVRYASVDLGSCRILAPVVIEESREDWWLWWIPLRHVGGAPYTYFELAVWIDSGNCRAAQPINYRR